MRKKEVIYPLSTILAIKKLRIKDLPISRPTYYDMIYQKRKTYEFKLINLARFLGLSKEYLLKSMELEKKILIEKKQKNNIS